MRQWGRHGKISNMHVERLLAQFRQASNIKSGHAPSVHRASSGGFCSQWRQEHIAAGGKDPSRTTRRDLLEKGVPLKAGQASRRVPGTVRAHFLFASNRWNNEGRGSGMSYKAFMRQACAMYEDLSQDEKDPWEVDARNRSDAGRAAAGEGAEVGPDQARARDESAPWGLASEKLPLDPEKAREYLARVFEIDLGPKSGFSTWGPSLSDDFLESMFILDSGMVPKDVSFVRHLSCRQSHYGMCMQQDRDIAATSFLARQLHGAHRETTTFWEIAISGEGVDDDDFQMFVFVGVARHRGPRVNLYLAADVEGNIITADLSSKHTSWSLALICARLTPPEIIPRVATRSLATTPLYESLLKARLGAHGAGAWLQLSEKQKRNPKFVDDEHKMFTDGIKSFSEKRIRKMPDVKEVGPKAKGEWAVIKAMRQKHVWSKGACVGWGATCGLHSNDSDKPDLKCKTRIDFGVGGLSPEECQLRLKRWLIAGLAIEDVGNPAARADHLGLKARSFAGGLSAAERDAALTGAGST
ncbi:unnamed protein product [Prorocentrum cordatum]|uniref:Uncharacterized protein n=1 Tax=Prorocentrum cordatum TaxID=2364126 RepID=A0ABN9SU14_9DINO|nr:unnamed protein product [Polarella glacialis]